jgi:hypothetical protein
MKFILEPFNRDFILRKVREEEKRVGRRVTRVELTPNEWCRFIETLRPSEAMHGIQGGAICYPRMEEVARYYEGDECVQPMEVQTLTIVRAT